jgi:two-component system, NarL family, response regulator NreC
MIRLLIVEDQPAVRKGLLMRLAAEHDFLVIGETGDGETALKMAIELCPDVVLIDVEMPNMDGIDATRAIHLACPHSSVIVLSIHDDAALLARAEDAGAVAFVCKSMPAETLLATIRQFAGFIPG